MAININQFVKFKQFELAPGVNNEHPLTNDIYLVGYDDSVPNLKEIKIALNTILGQIPGLVSGNNVYALCPPDPAQTFFLYDSAFGYRNETFNDTNIMPYEWGMVDLAITKQQMASTNRNDLDTHGMCVWNNSVVSSNANNRPSTLTDEDFGVIQIVRWGEPHEQDITHTFIIDVVLLKYDTNTSTWKFITMWSVQLGGTGSQGQDGRGIRSISKTGTNGLVDTYTIIYTDGSPFNYYITNGAAGSDGRGISYISGPESNGLNDTYTIHYTDTTKHTFTVANGASAREPEFRIDSSTGNVYVSYDHWATSGTIIGNAQYIDNSGGNVYTYAINVKANQSSCESLGDAYIDSNGDLMVLTTLPASDPSNFTSAGNIKGPQGNPGKQGDKGDKGDQGDPGTIGPAGEDGVSPTVSITESPNHAGHILTITDKNGDHSAFLSNGIDGQPGATGPEGPPGPSGSPGRGIVNITGPTQAPNQNSLVKRYTIRYTDNTTSTFDVTDGSNFTGIVGPVMSGLNATYTLTFSNGQSDSFTVTNGAQGPAGPAGTGFSLWRITVPDNAEQVTVVDPENASVEPTWELLSNGLYRCTLSSCSDAVFEYWDISNKVYQSYSGFTYPSDFNDYIQNKDGVAEVIFDEQVPWNYKEMMGCGMFGSFNQDDQELYFYSLLRPDTAAFIDSSGNTIHTVSFLVKVYDNLLPAVDNQ